MYPELKQKWLNALADPLVGPQQALLLLEQKSPWGYREVLHPRVAAHATDGATVTLIGPDASGNNRALKVRTEEVVIIEQLDYHYEEAEQGDLTAAINGGKLQLLIGGAEDPRLPTFTLDNFHVGDSVIQFGKIPLGWVLPREQGFELNLIPSGTAGGSFNLKLDLLIRREPRWLMLAAGLVEPGRP